MMSKKIKKSKKNKSKKKYMNIKKSTKIKKRMLYGGMEDGSSLDRSESEQSESSDSKQTANPSKPKDSKPKAEDSKPKAEDTAKDMGKFNEQIKKTGDLGIHITDRVDYFIFIDLINNAIRNPDYLLRIIRNTPIDTLEKFIDEQLAHRIVEVNGLCLEYLPVHLRNNIDICRTAVNQNNEAFDFVQLDIAMQINPNVTIFIDNNAYVVNRATVLTRTVLDNLLIQAGELNVGESNRCYFVTNDVVHLRYPQHTITQAEINMYDECNPYIIGFMALPIDGLSITSGSYGGAGMFARGNDNWDGLSRTWCNTGTLELFYSFSD